MSILVFPSILIPKFQHSLKQSHPVLFHLSGITLRVSSYSIRRVQACLVSPLTRASVEASFIMLNPVAVLETFFDVVVGRIAVMGVDEVLHFLVFL